MQIDSGDLLRLASKINARKTFNGLKVLAGYYLSRLIRRPLVWGLPVSLSMEPTTHCNLRCPQCPSGLRAFTRPTGIMDEQLFKEVIDEVQDTLLYLMLYFQGEPYLHPRFHELVRYASERRIYTATSTNAHYLSREKAELTVLSGLDRLIISIDGTDQDTYSKYRVGGKLDTVLEGIDALVRAKKRLKSKTPFIQLQFIVFGFNEHQVSSFRKLCSQWNLKPLIKSAQLYGDQADASFLPGDTELSRYTKEESGRLRIKGKQMNHCWKMWHSSVLTWDGRVVPCCFDKDAAHPFGQVNGQGFRRVWKSSQYDRFRQQIFKDRKGIDICRNCSEGSRVWL